MERGSARSRFTYHFRLGEFFSALLLGFWQDEDLSMSKKNLEIRIRRVVLCVAE